MSTWTEERVAELRRLCETAMTLTEIAEAMGVTKNVICGKAARLKIERPEVVKARHNGGGWGRYHARRKPVLLQQVVPSLPIGHLPAGGCLFPMWGNERPTHVYCGEKRREGRPYCPNHCAVAYLPPKAREAA